MKVKAFLFVLIFSVLGLAKAWSQQTVYDEPTILYGKSLQGGVHMHPHGWGVNLHAGKTKTVDKTFMYGVEFVGMKHPKESKQPNRFYEDSRRYTYGKLNSFYILRPMIGTKTMLTDKLRKNGVEVSLHSSFGPSLCITKPIYLEIRGEGSFDSNFLVVEAYDPEKHNVLNIYGRASDFLGFDKLKLRPGLYAKMGLYFETSPEQKQIKGLETGISMDAFLREVPIMATEENKQFFFSFYVNLFLGKRYNRTINE